jgi:GNAT superfamily N-acetyltransferase
MLVLVVLVSVDYSAPGAAVRSWLVKLVSVSDARTPRQAGRRRCQGIADRTATFETRPRTESDIRAWFDGAHPLLVVEQEGAAAAFAATFAYRPRTRYAGIAEASVYADRMFRRHGAGRMALEALIAAAAAGWSPRSAFARWGSTKNTANWTACGATW